MIDNLTLHPLDPRFVAPKPEQEAPEGRIGELDALGRLIITRKRDGYGGLVVATNSKKAPLELYTRSVAAIGGKFPYLVDALRSIAIPKRTLVMCELYWTDADGNEDLGVFSRFAKSADPRAALLQSELGSARAMLFTPLVAKGKDVSGVPYRDRSAMIGEWLNKRPHPLVTPMEHLPYGFDALKDRVVKERWEGLVLYDGDATTGFRIDGEHDRPPRPDGCWKWKPIFEDDFIATKFEPGTGRNTGLAGKIYIAQIDPRTKETVPCGEVPLHAREHKRFFAEATYPMVVQVEYEIRTPKGALRTAKVLRVRDDKSIGACLLPPRHQK